jgi:hypothetical protein
MTRKFIAIAVTFVLESLVINRARLYLLFASPLRVRQSLQRGEPPQRAGSPNFPSIQLRSLSSNCVCFFVSLLIFFGGRPNGIPLILHTEYLLFLRFALSIRSTGRALVSPTLSAASLLGMALRD